MCPADHIVTSSRLLPHQRRFVTHLPLATLELFTFFCSTWLLFLLLRTPAPGEAGPPFSSTDYSFLSASPTPSSHVFSVTTTVEPSSFPSFFFSARRPPSTLFGSSASCTKPLTDLRRCWSIAPNAFPLRLKTHLLRPGCRRRAALCISSCSSCSKRIYDCFAREPPATSSHFVYVTPLFISKKTSVYYLRSKNSCHHGSNWGTLPASWNDNTSVRSKKDYEWCSNRADTRALDERAVSTSSVPVARLCTCFPLLSKCYKTKNTISTNTRQTRGFFCSISTIATEKKKDEEELATSVTPAYYLTTVSLVTTYVLPRYYDITGLITIASRANGVCTVVPTASSPFVVFRKAAATTPCRSYFCTTTAANTKTAFLFPASISTHCMCKIPRLRVLLLSCFKNVASAVSPTHISLSPPSAEAYFSFIHSLNFSPFFYSSSTITAPLTPVRPTAVWQHHRPAALGALTTSADAVGVYSGKILRTTPHRHKLHVNRIGTPSYPKISTITAGPGALSTLHAQEVRIPPISTFSHKNIKAKTAAAVAAGSPASVVAARSTVVTAAGRTAVAALTSSAAVAVAKSSYLYLFAYQLPLPLLCDRREHTAPTSPSAGATAVAASPLCLPFFSIKSCAVSRNASQALSRATAIFFGGAFSSLGSEGKSSTAEPGGKSSHENNIKTGGAAAAVTRVRRSLLELPSAAVATRTPVSHAITALGKTMAPHTDTLADGLKAPSSFSARAAATAGASDTEATAPVTTAAAAVAGALRANGVPHASAQVPAVGACKGTPGAPECGASSTAATPVAVTASREKDPAEGEAAAASKKAQKKKEKEAAKAAAQAAKQEAQDAERRAAQALLQKKVESPTGEDMFGYLPLTWRSAGSGGQAPRVWSSIDSLQRLLNQHRQQQQQQQKRDVAAATENEKLGAVKEEDGPVVWVRGRLQESRGKGGLAFLLLREKGTSVQCVLDAKRGDASKDMIKWTMSLPLESIVDVEAVAVPAAVTVQAATEQHVELLPRRIYCVSAAAQVLPFQFKDASRSAEGETTTAATPEAAPRVALDTRLDHRVMDLRTAASQAVFSIISATAALFREFLLQHHFVEIHSPKLIAGASEGGASCFTLQYFGRDACLAQSPQLYKQMAICADFPRVFEIGPVFRAENSNTHRHLCEFTGVDLEMEIKEDYTEVLDLLDSLFKYVFAGLEKRCNKEISAFHAQYPAEPFVWQEHTPRLTFAEGVQLLRAANCSGIPDDISAFDLNTEQEKLLGRIIKEKYNTDYYMLLQYPTKVRPFYTMPSLENPEFSNSYDFFMRTEEIISGAQRVHDADMLTKRCIECGVPPASIQTYIDAFRLGSPPHGGAGIGLERVVMLFLGKARPTPPPSPLLP